MKPSISIESKGANLTELQINNSPLTDNQRYSYLLSDISSGTAGFYVQNIADFTTSQVLLVGELGREQSEIIITHSSTVPSGSLITLASNLVFNHPQDTKVYIIDWNKVEISGADTTTGSKTVLYLRSIQVDNLTLNTLHNDTVRTSGYYFARFYNDTAVIYSNYSDPIPYAGYADNTVWAIKDRALKSVNEDISPLITHNWLNSALWEARREIHNAPGKRPYRQRFNIDIGTVSGGMNKIEVPDDLHEPDSAKNIYGVRIGREQNLKYRDKKVIDAYYRGIANTQLIKDYATSDVTVYLANSRDFDASGSITAGTFTIGYSANSVANGSLMVSTAGESSASSGTEVWQNVALGLPQYFTVMRLGSAGTAYIMFERPVDSDYQGQNIYSDYYRTLVEYDSDADTLDEPPALIDGYVHYLSYKIKKRKNQGLIALDDSDFLEWQKIKKDALSNEQTNTEIRFSPDMGDWSEY